MRTAFNIVAVALWLAAAASAPAAAQETSVRSGIVTAIVPVQAAAAPPTTSTAGSRTAGVLGRAMGRVAGRAAARVGGGEHAYEAFHVAHDATEETVLAAASAGGSTGRQAMRTAYLVMVRFDTGLESSIRVADASHLETGRRVRVMGSGDGIRILPY